MALRLGAGAGVATLLPRWARAGLFVGASSNARAEGDPSWEVRRAWHGTIALDRETFVPFCLSWEAARWRTFLDRYQSAGLTHVYVQVRGRYRAQGDFDLRGNLDVVESRLRELRERRLVPILWASTGEWHGNNAAAILADWARMLHARPTLGALLPIVVPGPEFNDYLDPVNQHELIVGLARLFPGAYRVLHFTPGVGHGGPTQEPHFPKGPLPAAWGDGSFAAFWSAYRDGTVHALAYNMPRDERDNVFRIGDWNAEIARRDREAQQDMARRGDTHKAVYSLKQATRRLLTMVPRYEDAAAYPPVGSFDCVLGEFGAHDVLHGHRRWQDGEELRRLARQVPGITGTGD